MKTYIKPETIAVEMQSKFSMLAETGPSDGNKVANRYIGKTDSYTKSDNAWDDFDE